MDEIDSSRRRFLLTATSVLTAAGAGFALYPFIRSWQPSAKAEALGAPVEVDLSKMEPGQLVVVEWRGKPVWIIRRTEKMLNSLSDNRADLRDPDSLIEQQPEYSKNLFRALKKEFLVLIGVCTHLGCSPKYKPALGELGPNWPGGFYCPCHGSTFDLAGRVYKGVPAPVNLEVPPHRYVKDNVLIIGEHETETA